MTQCYRFLMIVLVILCLVTSIYASATGWRYIHYPDCNTPGYCYIYSYYWDGYNWYPGSKSWQYCAQHFCQ